MDYSALTKAAVAGIPLVFVILGIVEWVKSFQNPDGSQKFHGNVLLLISMGVGLLLGCGYMISQTKPPTGDWWTGYVYGFSVAVYGIAQGLVASGLYQVIKNVIERTFAKALKSELD